MIKVSNNKFVNIVKLFQLGTHECNLTRIDLEIISNSYLKKKFNYLT